MFTLGRQCNTTLLKEQDLPVPDEHSGREPVRWAVLLGRYPAKE